MKFVEFINYLKSEDVANKYMEQHHPDIDYYDAEVYLKKSLSLDSELSIFDGEKIEGRIEMEIDNEKYYNLFTLDHLVEICEDFAKHSKTDCHLAEKIINYRINDA